MSEPPAQKPFRVLSLDGGGAKGFYTLGVLHEIEALAGKPLHQVFDLIFGTSTGAIIAALLALGYRTDQVYELYKLHVVDIMKELWPWHKAAVLRDVAAKIFKDAKFTDFKTQVGIVTTNWDQERPMIFKGDVAQAFYQKDSFVPGFGVSVADAIVASCSAYPFFSKAKVKGAKGETFILADGGYCANNPALYSLTDATQSLGHARANVRLVSVGVGEYPPKRNLLNRLSKYWFSVGLIQKQFEINTRSMDQLRKVLFLDVPTVRISEKYTEPHMATDMFEHDMEKLGILWQRGRSSFSEHEPKLREFLHDRGQQ